MGVLDVVSLAILAILLVGVLFLILIVAAIPGVLAKKNAIVLGRRPSTLLVGSAFSYRLFGCWR